MQEAAEIEERWEEELRVAKEEVEKRLSIEESAVEYQHELWRRHYYEYYHLEDEDDDAVELSMGDTKSTNGGMSPGQVVDVSSYIGES
jgi:hypothetical protein